MDNEGPGVPAGKLHHAEAVQHGPGNHGANPVKHTENARKTHGKHTEKHYAIAWCFFHTQGGRFIPTCVG